MFQGLIETNDVDLGRGENSVCTILNKAVHCREFTIISTTARSYSSSI